MRSHDTLFIAAIVVSALVHAVWSLQVKSSSDRLATLIAIRCVGLLFGLSVFALAFGPA